MADNNSSQPIPEGWKYETKMTKEGCEFSLYVCKSTGQHFYTYEDMMQYVNYSRAAQLPISVPSFICGKDDKQNLDGLDSELILSSAKVVDLKTFEETTSALETNDPKCQVSAKPKISNNNKKRRRGQI